MGERVQGGEWEEGVILATVEFLELVHDSKFRIKVGLGCVVLSGDFGSSRLRSFESCSAVAESGGAAVPSGLGSANLGVGD